MFRQRKNPTSSLYSVLTVDYSISKPYRSVPGHGLQSAVEVALMYSGKTSRTVGILDSGSVLTVFSNEIATSLGIDVTAGNCVTVNTLGGRFDFYSFNLEIRFPSDGESFSGQVGFASTHMSRNILGRNLLFQRFEIGFRDAREMIHLRREE